MPRKHYQTVDHPKWEPQVGSGLFGIRLLILHFKFQFCKSPKRKGSIIQSLIKLSQDKREVRSLRLGFLFISFGLLFWVWNISKYTKHKQLNFYTWKLYSFQLTFLSSANLHWATAKRNPIWEPVALNVLLILSQKLRSWVEKLMIVFSSN